MIYNYFNEQINSVKFEANGDVVLHCAHAHQPNLLGDHVTVE